MTDDQHRAGQLTKAQLLIADTLERFATEPRDPTHVAEWLITQLRDHYGWRLPLDPTQVPPTRPDRIATDAERRAAMAEIRAVFNRPKNPPRDTPPGTSDDAVSGIRINT